MPRFTFVADLGGAPHGEPCAQLGHTDDFAAINAAEVRIYIAALIALHGPPPAGIRLRSFANHHDFGIYCTAIVEIDADHSGNPVAAAWLDAIEDSVERWIQAGFAPPIAYGPSGAATLGGRTVRDVIRGAMMTTRPRPDGSFFPPEFEQLHRNLVAGFPEVAAGLTMPG